MPKQITVTELKQMMEDADDFVLIDCREKDEFDYCRIEGSTLIPLSEFERRATNEIPTHKQVIIYCHHGGRSEHAGVYLETMGYKDVVNVVGGIEQWSLQVDSKIPRY